MYQYWGLYVGVAILFTGYIAIQSRAFLFAPPLELATPPIVKAKEGEEITIQGKASRLNQVMIGDQVIAMDKDGIFSQKIVVGNGTTRLRIRVTNRFGKERAETITIIGEP